LGVWVCGKKELLIVKDGEGKRLWMGARSKGRGSFKSAFKGHEKERTGKESYHQTHKGGGKKEGG